MELISQITIWSVLPPTIIGCIFYRKLNANTKWIAIMVFLACIPHSVRALESYTEIDMKDSRYIFYNIYMVQELLLLTLFFNRLFLSKTTRTIFKVSVILCFSLGVILIINNGFTDFLKIWLSFNNVAYTMWALLLLYKLYERDDIEFNFSDPLLFYIFGLFFYTSCTIPVLGLWDYMMNNENSYLNNLKIIHFIFNVIMYLLFSIGFIMEMRLFKLKKYTQK